MKITLEEGTLKECGFSSDTIQGISQEYQKVEMARKKSLQKKGLLPEDPKIIPTEEQRKADPRDADL